VGQQEGLTASNVNWTQAVNARDDLWQQVFENPPQWWDWRQLKASGNLSENHPDFQHKTTEAKVWLDSFFRPHWVPERLAEMEALRQSPWVVATKADSQTLKWRQLFNQPSNWVDFRSLKQSSQLDLAHPDFVQEADGTELWINDECKPEWVTRDLEKADLADMPPWRIARDAETQVWHSVIQEPDKWIDFRAAKIKGKAAQLHPDFVQRWSGQLIWLESPQLPRWVPAALQAAGENDEWPWLLPDID